MPNLSIILGSILLIMFALGVLFLVFLSQAYVFYSLGFLFIVVSAASFLIYLIKKFT